MHNYMIFRHDAKRPIPIADASVHCVVTSPPYWGLRDYGTPGQIGLEPTPQEYVETMVRVFREARRVLRDDGTCWLNLGDSYAAHPGQRKATDKAGSKQQSVRGSQSVPSRSVDGLKPKDLVGIPWRVALALQSDGWYLRSDIIWHKPNPMPESVTDRPTKGHEYVFLLTKRERYYYDADAVKEAMAPESKNRYGYAFGGEKNKSLSAMNGTGIGVRTRPIGNRETDGTRNLRTVWTIATQPYPGSHFAVMPPKLAETCIKAGCPVGGIVLDPFNGAGTTGVVALGLGRRYIGSDNNPDYLMQAKRRIDRPHARPETVRTTEETMPLFTCEGATP